MITGVTGAPAGVKVLVATKPVDFRKSMDGLARPLKEEMKAERSPAWSTSFVPSVPIDSSYCGTARVVLYAKRLEQGAFCWPKGHTECDRLRLITSRRHLQLPPWSQCPAYR